MPPFSLITRGTGDQTDLTQRRYQYSLITYCDAKQKLQTMQLLLFFFLPEIPKDFISKDQDSNVTIAGFLYE